MSIAKVETPMQSAAVTYKPRGTIALIEPRNPSYVVRSTTWLRNQFVVEPRARRACCAKCFVYFTSFCFLIIGIVMMAYAGISLSFLAKNAEVLFGGFPQSAASMVCGVGATMFVSSLIVWVAACKHTFVCSKIILALFSVWLLFLFGVQVAGIAGSTWGVGHMGPQANVTQLLDGCDMFNQTMTDLYTACCDVNATGALEDACHQHLDEQDPDGATCQSMDTFVTAILTFLAPVLKTVIIVCSIVAFLVLVSFCCVCCLLCKCQAPARRALYRPPVVTYNVV